MHPGFERLEGSSVLMMDVGHDRDRAAGNDLRQPDGSLGFVAGAADDVASGGGQRVDLLQGGLVVGRLGDRHRLHGDRRSTADRHVTDHDLTGLLTREGDRSGVHGSRLSPPASSPRIGPDQPIGSMMSRQTVENIKKASSATTA